MKKILQKTLVLFLLFTTLTIGLPALAQDLPSASPKLTEQQLDELVGRIALYPDPLLAQMLPASTYPLEVVQAARLIKKEKDFDKIDKRDWDPSVKAIAYYPTVTKMMNDDLAWMQQLGSAVITQQEDVMASIQRMRNLAHNAGNLQTTKEQIVNATPTTIEIVSASPEIVYVPVYNPAVVYVVPVVRPRIPFISFIAWRIGRWLEVGFYWPSYTIYYSGPTWWYGDWHRHYHRHVRHSHGHGHVTHVTNITNIYNVKNVKNVWKHNSKRVVTHTSKNDRITKNNVTKKQDDNLDNFKKQMKKTEVRTPKTKQANNFKGSKKDDSPKNAKGIENLRDTNQPKSRQEIKTGAEKAGTQETGSLSNGSKQHSKTSEVKKDRSVTREHKNTISQKQPLKNTSKNISRNSGRGSSTQFPGSSKSRGRN